MQARQGEPLVDPRKALLWRPRRVAGEGDLLTVRALHEATVGQQGLCAAAAIMRGARPELGVLELGQLAPPDVSSLDRRERLLALERSEIGDEQRQPGGLLEVRLRGDPGIQPGRLAGQRRQACDREGDLPRQAAGVLRRAQAWGE